MIVGGFEISGGEGYTPLRSLSRSRYPEKSVYALVKFVSGSIEEKEQLGGSQSVLMILEALFVWFESGGIQRPQEFGVLVDQIEMNK